MAIKVPTKFLYHGTVNSYAESIEEQGLKGFTNNKVYMTSDLHVAYDYALNKKLKCSGSCEVVVCVIDAVQMNKDGYVFDHTVDNAEWTTANVPPEYVVQIQIDAYEELYLIEDVANRMIFN